MASNLVKKYRNGGKACRTGQEAWLRSFDRAAYRQRIRYGHNTTPKSRGFWRVFAHDAYICKHFSR